MNLDNQVGKYFLQYHSTINGGVIYFAGDYKGPWTRDLNQAKGYYSKARIEKAKERLALKESAYCPPFPEEIRIVRVILRPVIEMSIGEGWIPAHPSCWS